MGDNGTGVQRAAPPNIPARWCTCGRRLMWCGVREAWVDTAHRASHDENGKRIPHNTAGKTTPAETKVQR